jgi:hypothetical protein
LRTINLIDKLANIGKCEWNTIAAQLRWITEIEFREAIRSMIPSFNKPLEDAYWFIRWKVVELIGKLANHGE